jgi:hypothetical protein
MNMSQATLDDATGVSFWNSDGGECIDGFATIAALGRGICAINPGCPSLSRLSC